MKSEIRGIIFDIDGVLTYQGKVYPGARETVEYLRNQGIILRFLTNSTLKSRKSCADKLNKAGFHINTSEVITASYATAMYLRKKNPVSCWVMLDGEGLQEFKEFRHNENNPEYIIVGDYRNNFNFNNMNKALRLMIKGSQLIVMIPELIDTSLGEIELNVGSWAGMLERATGTKAVYVGKPNPFVFDLTVDTTGLPKERVCIVGDSISTDIQGANNVGIKSVLLKTGAFEIEKHLVKTVKTDWIIDSIEEVGHLFT